MRVTGLGKNEGLSCVILGAFRGVTSALEFRIGEGVNPVVFTVSTTTCAELAVFLGTPHKDYPAYSLFKPQSQLTTNESIDAVHY